MDVADDGDGSRELYCPFELPEDEYGEMMFERRLAMEGSASPEQSVQGDSRRPSTVADTDGSFFRVLYSIALLTQGCLQNHGRRPRRRREEGNPVGAVAKQPGAHVPHDSTSKSNDIGRAPGQEKRMTTRKKTTRRTRTIQTVENTRARAMKTVMGIQGDLQRREAHALKHLELSRREEVRRGLGEVDGGADSGCLFLVLYCIDTFSLRRWRFWLLLDSAWLIPVFISVVVSMRSTVGLCLIGSLNAYQ